MRLLLFLTIAIAPAALSASADDEAASLRSAYANLVARYANEVAYPPSPAAGELLFVVEDQYSPRTSPRAPITAGQREFANELFALARRAAERGEASLAFQWATEVLRADPDHVESRRALGYESVDGVWRTAFARRMSEQAKTWHPRFGWIASADVPRWEAGQRPLARSWISAGDDRERHRDIADGWNIRTDHFLVTTNHGIEAGVELATRLERLYQVWRQLFAGFYLSDREVRDLFAGMRAARGRSKPFHVFYHRDQQEYVAQLRHRQPRIAETLGIYFDTDREAHFFAHADGAESEAASSDHATLYHEAVHQLFQESQRSARRIGDKANFWVVEGVATYFESLREHETSVYGRYFTIGEPTTGRLPAARERALGGEFYLPLAELTRLGQAELQRHPELARLYSQGAGLATFLMQGEQGRHREAMVRYLSSVYAGRDHPDTLAEFADSSYGDLDRRYRQFLQSLP